MAEIKTFNTVIRGIGKLLFLLFIHTMAWGQSEQRLLIDPLYARGGTISELVDEVTFIPLETTKESTFGIAQRIQSSNSSFSFYDVTTNAIFIFYKNGKFRSKIEVLPNLNVEATRQFSSLENFVVNQYSEYIYIIYDLGDKSPTKYLAIFNPDGKLVQSIKLNTIFDNLSSSFAFLDSTTTVFANYRGRSSTKFTFHTVKNFETILSDIVKIDSTNVFNKSWANNYGIQTISTNGSLWNRLYDNVIYNFYKDGTLSSHKILLPASLTLDQEFYKDTVIIGNRSKSNEYLSNHRDKVSYLTNFQKMNDWLSFSCVKYNMSGPKDVYLVNFKNSDLFSLGKISPDSLSYSIPIFTAGALVVGSEENYLYVSIPSFALYNTIKNLANKRWETDPVLSTYFKTQNQKSNPVLIRLRLKRRFG